MKNAHGPYHPKEFLLLASEDRYKALVENSIHAYFLVNTEGSILESNYAALTTFGYSSKELLSINTQHLFTPADILQIKERDKNAYLSVETTGIKKNGGQFPIELSSVVFSDNSGEIRTAIMVYDLSKTKNTGQQQVAGTHTADVNFKPVIESITDGFFTLNNDWIITYWNKEVEKLSGIKKETIVGKSFLDFFQDMADLKFFSECRMAKQENISVHFEEFYETANIWVEVHAYPSETGLTVFCKNISEQKTTEAVMKLSNERYDMVVKATNDLVWDWDIMTGEIYRNINGVKRVYGHSSNDSIKTNQLWAGNIHPLDREKIDQQIAYYITSEDESSFSFEYRYKTEEGNYNYIEDKGYIIRNELGIVVRMIGAARNITEQKQIARNIEESEQRYKMFVQQSMEGIWRIELEKPMATNMPVDEMITYCMSNSYIAECNDAFARMYGFDNANGMIGITLDKILPVDNTANRSFLKKFFDNNFNIREEISYEKDKDGNPLIFVNNMQGIIENGCLIRTWGTQREVTEQKRAEALLLASEAQYRYLFNHNPSCIFIWDTETLRFIEVNEVATELYGYTRTEFLNLTVLDIRPSSEHNKFMEAANVAKQNDVYKKTMTWTHINKKGDGIFMEISSHNITYNGKKAVLAIGNNVSDKILLENSLNEERQIKQKQITDAVITGQERERSELGEELHDNINQILASTKLYIECALADEVVRKELLEKGRVLLDSAMKEIRKLSRTLLPPSLGDVTLLESLNDLTKDTLQVTPVKIHKHWDNFNENSLSQKLKLTIFRIIQEQLNNIYKHARAKNVTITLDKNDDQIRVEIKDDGIGFDPQTKRTGVGIRNITSRAEVNNGTVLIESSPGNGCELVVEFSLS